MNDEVTSSPNKSCKDLEVPPPQDDESCSDEVESSITDLYTNINEKNLVQNVKAIHNDHQVFSSIIEKENQKKILSVVNKYDLRFSKDVSMAIQRVKFIDVLPYFNKIGSIIHLGTISCLVQNNDIFYLFYLSSEYITHLDVTVFSTSMEKLLEACEQIKETLDPIIIHNEINMQLNWYYYSHPKIKNYYVTEEINDAFIKEAYPYLNIDQIVSGYLESQEPVLILLGPPGTGKTRLIRYILKNIHQKHGSLKVAFTSDQHVIENSEIFLDFLLGEFSTLVIEDIDYHLRPRKDGNAAMYNFLTASNSIVINYFVNKKIILSTNLPDAKNIDEALIRPGRCFDIIETRSLINEEAKNLSKVLNKTESLPDKKYTIAEIFNASSRNKLKKSGF